ncbi:MAG: ATP-binding protein [Clostridia bacterium]|nr:ATP-binding protein [Clostridia bacterium]
MDKKDVLQQVQRQFEKKRQTAEAKAQIAIDFACKNKDFALLESQRRSLVFDMGKNLFLGESVDQMQNKLDEILAKQAQILDDMGMKTSDLLPQYECDLCNDKGYVNGERCSCFQQAINKILSDNSNLCDVSLSLETAVAKNDLQSDVIDLFKKYLANVQKVSKRNVFITGGTGTGKTHLITCLANDLLKQNYSVLFTSAFNLNNLFLQIHLAPVGQKGQMLSNLLNTDVLVIDDLGSENKYNNVTEEYFCNLLSERMAKGKYTFFTSNLGKQIQDVYGDRFYSRIFSQKTLLINLQGKDLRVSK